MGVVARFGFVDCHADKSARNDGYGALLSKVDSRVCIVVVVTCGLLKKLRLCLAARLKQCILLAQNVDCHATASAAARNDKA